MPGLVFVSCGQASESEKVAAQRVRDLLKNEFRLDSYLAFRVQGLNDIMSITEKLKVPRYSEWVNT